MRQSHLFSKTKKEAARDEVAKGTKYLLQAGYIYKEMAGVYDFLPLGWKVLENIIEIIEEEMTEVGGQRVELSALQTSENWMPTNRWSDEEVDVWFKTKLKNETELGLAFTHEEPLTALMREHINSYRDLEEVVKVYQFQKKFRNEVRAKSGIMRTREFVMKDMYTFAKNEADHKQAYQEILMAYERIFKRLGIGADTTKTYASGGTFSKFSDEFQTKCEIGEDTIYVHTASNEAINDEIYSDEVLSELAWNSAEVEKCTAAEVGNTFTLGTKFSEALGLTYKDQSGETVPVFMGSYGMGPARIMGVMAEIMSDDKGLVWPKAVAPYKLHVIQIGDGEEVKKAVNEIETAYTEKVLVDDRDQSPGHKLGDADLIGLPHRVVVSERSLAAGGYELHARIGDTEDSIISRNQIESLLD